MRRPRDVDVHVGARLRLCRKLLGMSQARLGEAVGLTFQQIQKYERGTNRIGAGRLYQFGEVLDVPVTFFFDNMPAQITFRLQRSTKAKKGVTADVSDEGEALELVRAYYKIEDSALRNDIRSLMKACGQPAPRKRSRRSPGRPKRPPTP